MLVLSRKVGERILIGDNVVVEVLQVRGGHIRLGISAPAEVRIRREELPGPGPDQLERGRRVQPPGPSPLPPGASSPTDPTGAPPRHPAAPETAPGA
jgi:carbon storage regulator